MGELISWKLWYKEDPKKKCAKCGMTEKKGCCEDQHQLVKMEEDQNVVPSKLLYTDLQFQQITVIYPDAAGVIISSKFLFQPNVHGPPRANKIPVFLRNRVFRI